MQGGEGEDRKEKRGKERGREKNENNYEHHPAPWLRFCDAGTIYRYSDLLITYLLTYLVTKVYFNLF